MNNLYDLNAVVSALWILPITATNDDGVAFSYKTLFKIKYATL